MLAAKPNIYLTVGWFRICGIWIDEKFSKLMCVCMVKKWSSLQLTSYQAMARTTLSYLLVAQILTLFI